MPHDPGGIALLCLASVVIICLLHRKHSHEKPEEAPLVSFIPSLIEPREPEHDGQMQRKTDETIFRERINQLVQNKIARGYNIQTICRDIPVSPSTLYKWRMGETFPNRKSVERVAAYFGVSVQWLYSENTEKEYHSLLDEAENKAERIGTKEE